MSLAETPQPPALNAPWESTLVESTYNDAIASGEKIKYVEYLRSISLQRSKEIMRLVEVAKDMTKPWNAWNAIRATQVQTFAHPNAASNEDLHAHFTQLFHSSDDMPDAQLPQLPQVGALVSSAPFEMAEL